MRRSPVPQVGGGEMLGPAHDDMLFGAGYFLPFLGDILIFMDASPPGQAPGIYRQR